MPPSQPYPPQPHRSDMGTEETIIKDLKGSGGIVGITNQKSALVRWTK
jgi:hypothetical protein